MNSKKPIIDTLNFTGLTATHGRGRGGVTLESTEKDYIKANTASKHYFAIYSTIGLAFGFGLGVGLMPYYVPVSITGLDRWFWAVIGSLLLAAIIFSFACARLWRPISSFWVKRKYPGSPYYFPQETRDVGPLEFLAKTPIAFILVGLLTAYMLYILTPHGEEGKTIAIILITAIVIGGGTINILVNYFRFPKFDTTYRTFSTLHANAQYVKHADILPFITTSNGILATTINALQVEKYSKEFDEKYYITRPASGITAVQPDGIAFSTGTLTHAGPYEDYSYIHIALPHSVPQFLLDYDATNSLSLENFTHRLSSTQEYKLEGLYGTTTSIYAPSPSIARYALYVFTPDVMEIIASVTPKADIEVVGKDLFIVWKSNIQDIPKRIEHEIFVLNTVGSALYENIIAYKMKDASAQFETENLILTPLGSAAFAAKDALQAKIKLKWRRAQYAHLVKATLLFITAIFIGLFVWAFINYDPNDLQHNKPYQLTTEEQKAIDALGEMYRQ